MSVGGLAVLMVNLAALVVCAAIFSISVTGREGLDDWEIANLNTAAAASGAASVVLCITFLLQVL